MTCYVFTFSRRVTSWKLILQSITVLFIIEIEYMTLLEVMKETLMIKTFG
jgi:hypothetical protein